jgi:hypothetical protein
MNQIFDLAGVGADLLEETYDILQRGRGSADEARIAREIARVLRIADAAIVWGLLARTIALKSMIDDAYVQAALQLKATGPLHPALFRVAAAVPVINASGAILAHCSFDRDRFIQAVDEAMANA